MNLQNAPDARFAHTEIVPAFVGQIVRLLAIFSVLYFAQLASYAPGIDE